jgi:hypothetical protein
MTDFTQPDPTATWHLPTDPTVHIARTITTFDPRHGTAQLATWCGTTSTATIIGTLDRPGATICHECAHTMHAFERATQATR